MLHVSYNWLPAVVAAALIIIYCSNCKFLMFDFLAFIIMINFARATVNFHLTFCPLS